MFGKNNRGTVAKQSNDIHSGRSDLNELYLLVDPRKNNRGEIRNKNNNTNNNYYSNNTSGNGGGGSGDDVSVLTTPSTNSPKEIIIPTGDNNYTIGIQSELLQVKNELDATRQNVALLKKRNEELEDLLQQKEENEKRLNDKIKELEKRFFMDNLGKTKGMSSSMRSHRTGSHHSSNGFSITSNHSLSYHDRLDDDCESVTSISSNKSYSCKPKAATTPSKTKLMKRISSSRSVNSTKSMPGLTQSNHHAYDRTKFIQRSKSERGGNFYGNDNDNGNDFTHRSSNSNDSGKQTTVSASSRFTSPTAESSYAVDECIADNDSDDDMNDLDENLVTGIDKTGRKLYAEELSVDDSDDETKSWNDDDCDDSDACQSINFDDDDCDDENNWENDKFNHIDVITEDDNESSENSIDCNKDENNSDDTSNNSKFLLNQRNRKNNTNRSDRSANGIMKSNNSGRSRSLDLLDVVVEDQTTEDEPNDRSNGSRRRNSCLGTYQQNLQEQSQRYLDMMLPSQDVDDGNNNNNNFYDFGKSMRNVRKTNNKNISNKDNDTMNLNSRIDDDETFDYSNDDPFNTMYNSGGGYENRLERMDKSSGKGVKKGNQNDSDTSSNNPVPMWKKIWKR